MDMLFSSIASDEDILNANKKDESSKPVRTLFSKIIKERIYIKTALGTMDRFE